MKIRNKQTGQIIEVTEDQLADYGLDTMAKGGMIKRADGSYSRRGLWDNIRANKGSGKKPTKEMLKQEKKIRAAEKAYGGYMQQGGITDWWMANGGYLPMAQEGMEQSVPMVQPSMLQPVDQTQLPLRQGVAEQVPFTIRGEYSAKEVKEKAAPKYVGLVDYLASKGMASDKESRKALAKKLGIKDYDFSAAKNTELLKLLKSNDKINTKVAEHQQYTFPESLSSDVMSTPLISPNVNVPIGIPKVGGHAEVPQGEGLYPQRYYDLQRIISSGGLRNVPRLPNIQVPIYPKSGVRTGQMINTPYFAEGGINNPGFMALPEYVQEKIKANMATGGCMSCGGKMQGGGNVSIKQIEKDAKWKPSDKKYIPLPPAPIVDYPPSYIIDETLPPIPPQPFNYPIGRYNLPGTYVQTPEFAEGGKLPKEILKARLEAHMSPSEAQDYLNTYAMGGELDEAGDGKWIQKATASIKRRGTEGVCTGSKFGGPSCRPGTKRYNLAKTFKKMAKARKKEDGGYAVGSQHEMTDAQIAKLRAMGYKIKEV